MEIRNKIPDIWILIVPALFELLVLLSKGLSFLSIETMPLERLFKPIAFLLDSLWIFIGMLVYIFSFISLFVVKRYFIKAYEASNPIHFAVALPIGILAIIPAIQIIVLIF